MNEQKAVPHIRYKGFEGKWKNLALGKITKFINGRAFKQSELLDYGKYQVLRVGNFYTNNAWYYSNLELPEKYYANKGDLLFTWSATFGPHIWEGNKVIYHYHIWKLELAPFVDKEFVLQLLLRDKDLLTNNTNGSTMIHITKSEMENKEVKIPSDFEQQKIGSLFTKLDKLLDLQQQKVDKLELLKKALLQNLFPKHDAQIPELRFKGFYNKWERTTISEMGKVTTGNTPPTKQKRYYSKMGIPWITPSNIDKNGNLYNVKYLSKDGAKIGRIVPKGSVLVTSIASIGKNTLLKEDSAFNQQINAITPKKKYNSYFLYTACNQLSKEMKVIASAGTMQIVNKKEFSKMLINCPLLPEQQKIGNLLSKVDQLIELENKKLHNLQQVKKCLLQNMFVE